jgi:hypothetical protein
MRPVVLLLSLSLLALSACHRQQHKDESFAETFAEPAPPGQEEKWVEPEPTEAPPAPKPPPPPVPTSPPPTANLGFTFGATKADTMRACTRQGAWGHKGESYTCSRVPDGSVAGKPLLAFCNDALCAVGVAEIPKESDWNTWSARYAELKQALVDKHGPATSESDTVPEDCQNEQFVECLKEGKASAEAVWIWKEGHRVSIRMSAKQSAEGPPAIRLVSMKQAPEESAPEAAAPQ